MPMFGYPWDPDILLCRDSSFFIQSVLFKGTLKINQLIKIATAYARINEILYLCGKPDPR